MNSPSKPKSSRAKTLLAWVTVIASLAIICGACLWWYSQNSPRPVSGPENNVAFSIVMAVLGVAFLVAGALAYAATIHTTCLTFNFTRPIWTDLKIKMYFANIFVPLLPAMGLGFILSAFLSPALEARGLDRNIASFAPILGMIFVLQAAQLWILIWGPLEKRAITRRLQALGITDSQLKNAFLVGLSNPEKSSFKKLGVVEEDIGGFWISPEQLIYRGDGESFGLTRNQIARIEQKSDAGSTSILGGIEHVVLHVTLADGNTRQIRLHTEGLMTMGAKKRMMERLCTAILNWHNSPQVLVSTH